MSALSGVVGSLISAQVAGIVIGQNPEEASSDYFRLSTGVYDAAAVGGVQVTRFATVYPYSTGSAFRIIRKPPLLLLA